MVLCGQEQRVRREMEEQQRGGADMGKGIDCFLAFLFFLFVCVCVFDLTLNP